MSIITAYMKRTSE